MLTCLDGGLIVSLFVIGGTEVVQVGDILMELPGLGIVLDGLLEVSLLVVLCTKLLFLFGLGLCLGFSSGIVGL